jgi:hypothetical protein
MELVEGERWDLRCLNALLRFGMEFGFLVWVSRL